MPWHASWHHFPKSVACHDPPTVGEDGKTAAVLTLGRGDANLAAAELYRRLGFLPMPEELFVDPEDLSVLGKGNLVMSSTD